jgi:hypothetical protein
MKRAAHSFAILVTTLLVFDSAGAAPVSGNAIISVKNGPLAGDYKLDPGYASCMHSKARANYSMGFKDFNAHGAHALAQGGMQVFDNDRTGNKRGNLSVTFGDPDHDHTTYEISRGVATLIVKGNAVTMSLEGVTSSDIHISMTVDCAELLEVP